jgi:hypothetical protein
MTAPWSSDELQRLDLATELEIAVKRADGTLRRWTPIWVVCADGQAYVRTWHRRDTGWFGQALRSHRARIRVPGLEADVVVEDIGEGTVDSREKVDSAYQLKYAAGSESMLSSSAVLTTLRLDHESAAGNDSDE